jgi:hypothetical protein
LTLTFLGSEDGVIIEKLMMLLGKIDEMKNQRHMLNEQLRQAIQDDDITKILVTRGETNQEVCFYLSVANYDLDLNFNTHPQPNLGCQRSGKIPGPGFTSLSDPVLM